MYFLFEFVNDNHFYRRFGDDVCAFISWKTKPRPKENEFDCVWEKLSREERNELRVKYAILNPLTASNCRWTERKRDTDYINL